MEILNMKEKKGKYISEDGKYYIGQFNDDLPNGKGIEYYKNGNILYEGEYVNGKREGKGKYFDEFGTYYDGQWKNNLKNGQGKICLPNGIIIYEGNFMNNKTNLNCVIN